MEPVERNGLGLVLRRLAGLAATLAAVSAIIFVLMSVLPGDQASVMLGTSAQPETLAALRVELGLDRPVWVRYLDWAHGLLTGDIGTSVTYGVPVGGLIAERAAVTAPLALMSMVLAAALSLPLAMAAARGNRPAEWAAALLAQGGIALPNFFIGLLLILALTQSGLFPAGGFPGWGNTAEALHALVLPAVALAIPQAAVLLRVARNALREAMRANYIRTARAKGLSETQIVIRHAFRNVLGPVLTLAALQISYLVAGTVLVESVFVLPGLGQLAYQALAQRDIAVLQATVLTLVAFVIIVNFLADIIIAASDPRLGA